MTLPTCAKCNNDVKKVYDCDHTDFEEYCVECYTELHYYLTERWTLAISIISLNQEFFPEKFKLTDDFQA